MYKIAVCLTFILSLSASFTFAQQPQDYKGHYINAKGDVYFQGEKIGLVTKEGIIQDAQGKKSHLPEFGWHVVGCPREKNGESWQEQRDVLRCQWQSGFYGER